ncbi:MAG: anhydro-N-acetylmuramic acid kinase [Alphaproteobacteria bacterium]|nr:MAG: anhydro-N-acetylmuramic acid kinase [Alphaproteobacteria bacterium]
MGAHKVYRAIGLMSGTSLDGVIDVALIETDGHGYVKPLRYYAHPYDIAVRDKVRACFGKTARDAQIDEVEQLVTDIHIDAVKGLGEKADIIGFHGQTVTHKPDDGFTWQLGDGQVLAKATGMDVVCDMRQADIKAGGQGAPLLPLYHQALFSDHDKPVAVLNLGGVANITYMAEDGGLIAFDCGPANALMDDFIKSRTGEDFDKGGRMASRGAILENVVQDFLADPYFTKAPPKSLDRDHWSIECVRYASTADGMATLLEMSVCGIEKAMDYLLQKPARIYAAGGGRYNEFMLAMIAKHLGIPVENIDVLGWNGDATEAEGFAYLAVRSLLGLPLTLPATTGVPKALTGGVLCAA